MAKKKKEETIQDILDRMQEDIEDDDIDESDED